MDMSSDRNSLMHLGRAQWGRGLQESYYVMERGCASATFDYEAGGLW